MKEIRIQPANNVFVLETHVKGKWVPMIQEGRPLVFASQERAENRLNQVTGIQPVGQAEPNPMRIPVKFTPPDTTKERIAELKRVLATIEKEAEQVKKEIRSLTVKVPVAKVFKKLPDAVKAAKKKAKKNGKSVRKAVSTKKSKPQRQKAANSRSKRATNRGGLRRRKSLRSAGKHNQNAKRAKRVLGRKSSKRGSLRRGGK
jgi:hypothetical protein